MGGKEDLGKLDGISKPGTVEDNSESTIDLSNAIVVYGKDSPMSEVTIGLKKVKLKRGMEASGDGQMSKRRKLRFIDSYEHITVQKYEIQRKGGRRSVKSIQRQIRRGRGLKIGELKVLGESNVDNIVEMNSTVVEERMVVGEEITEGLGGWPQTATKVT